MPARKTRSEKVKGEPAPRGTPADAPKALYAEIVAKLGAWFDAERRDLSWRRTRDPYAIWLSEVMLQQTRVKTVEDYFPRFLKAYPTVSHLAKADISGVLAAWSGLGYYRRARALHAGAREVVEQYGGKIPGDAASLRSISGIGPYTAGAISSIAFGAQEALVDGNVARVLARIFALQCDVRSPAGLKQVWELAKALVPADRPGRHNESLMELGATICLPSTPRCEACPVRTLCEGRRLGIEKELPIAKKKKAPREVNMLALVSRRGKSVLLGRRLPGGLFGGLWEPPMIECGDSNAESSLAKSIGAALDDVKHVAEQTHILTHRRLRITIATARIKSEPSPASGTPYECLAWKGASELGSLAMSSLAKKVLLACPG
ncbi:MAG: A/G-specific adenine glycosylase [Polyangiaceae bacterium]